MRQKTPKIWRLIKKSFAHKFNWEKIQEHVIKLLKGSGIKPGQEYFCIIMKK
jgi:hypothetical protein